MSGISRRRLLQLGGGAAAAGLAGGRGLAAASKQLPEMRIGAVLPTQTGLSPIGGQTSYRVAADAARRGLVMAGDEYAKNAELLGRRLKVYVTTAPDAEAARRAAARLTAVQGVYSLIGGFGTEQAMALSELAEERQVPFFNIAASADRLRGDPCRRYTFHVEASAAMYLQALAAWFIRAGHRRYFFVVGDTAEQHAHYQRMRSALQERHFGAEEAGHTVVSDVEPVYGDAFKQIRQTEPDAVILMQDAVSQLDFLAQYEGTELTDIPVTGYPSPVAQTRTFYAASRNASAHAGSGYRAALWEATLDAYGARELNARFLERWGRPMNPSAWAGYVSVKMLYEAAAYGGTIEGPGVLSYLENPSTQFDVYKGVGVSFRPWNHQLRQTLYLVKIDPEATTARNLATLVGELPAIYKAGTKPIESLDQIGIPPGESECSIA